MDGPSLMNFTVGAVPQVITEILQAAGLAREDVHLYLMHQATLKMLQQLQQRLELSDEQLPICLEECGNTVSSTIPILIAQLRQQQRLSLNRHHLVIGFGVGWSWAGCVWTPTS
jgi:3-oxoacyl-[acyl-carrier-protein] synthase-3